MIDTKEAANASENAATAAKDSVDIARKEFNATHRPKIKIHFIEFIRIPGKDPSNPGKDGDTIGARLLCFNVGESRAIVVQVHGKITNISNITINTQRELVKTFPVVESGEKFTVDIKSDWLVREIVDRTKLGHAPFKLLGAITYFDGNGTRREIAFCREYDASSKGWTKIVSPVHEYEY